jgi:hypothetical protein
VSSSTRRVYLGIPKGAGAAGIYFRKKPDYYRDERKLFFLDVMELAVAAETQNIGHPSFFINPGIAVAISWFTAASQYFVHAGRRPVTAGNQVGSAAHGIGKRRIAGDGAEDNRRNYQFNFFRHLGLLL